MPSMNNKIRRNIMRVYFHKVLLLKGQQLFDMHVEYNNKFKEIMDTYYSNPYNKSANDAGIELHQEHGDLFKIRKRGQEPVELPYFDLAKSPNFDKCAIKGDEIPYSENGLFYSLAAAINPDCSESFSIANWDSVLLSFIQEPSYLVKNRYKYPKIKNPIVIPSKELNCLVNELRKIKTFKKDLARALETINTIISIHKSTDALKGAWPEGASIINHGIVKSSNTLPAKYIKQANEIAKLR